MSSGREQIDGCCQDQERGAILLQSAQAGLGEAQLLFEHPEDVFHLGADMSLGLLTTPIMDKDAWVKCNISVGMPLLLMNRSLQGGTRDYVLPIQEELPSHARCLIRLAFSW